MCTKKGIQGERCNVGNAYKSCPYIMSSISNNYNSHDHDVDQ